MISPNIDAMLDGMSVEDEGGVVNDVNGLVEAVDDDHDEVVSL